MKQDIQAQNFHIHIICNSGTHSRYLIDTPAITDFKLVHSTFKGKCGVSTETRIKILVQNDP